MAPTPRTALPLLLAAFAGGAYSLAFPPFSLPGVAFFTSTPLFVAAALLSPARAALAGFVWATTAALALGHWLPATIASFFQVPLALGWAGLLVLAWLPAGVPVASCCAWLSWATARRAFAPLTAAAAFGLTEVARTYAWPPLPYAPLGSAALPEALVQSVDTIGVFGLGMLVAGVNALLAFLLVPSLRTRRAGVEAVLLSILIATAAGIGTTGPGGRDASSRALRIAAVQPGVTTRLAPSDSAEATERYRIAVEATRGLEGSDVDLVVWPEHAVGFYLREPTRQSETLLALSRELHADLLLGGPHYRYATPEPRYYASAFLLDGGELRGRHDKTELVPLAEIAYSPGDSIRPLAGQHAKVGALICAEILFPGVARELSRDGAEILANPSNDAWLVPAAAEHLLRIARLRAIENRRPLVRATPTGVSAVIDAQGHVLARSLDGTRQVVEASVQPGRQATPIQRVGDWPVWLATLGIAFVTLERRRTRA